MLTLLTSGCCCLQSDVLMNVVLDIPRGGAGKWHEWGLAMGLFHMSFSDTLLTTLLLQSLMEPASAGSLCALEAFWGVHVGGHDTVVKLPKLRLCLLVSLCLCLSFAMKIHHRGLLPRWK